MAGMSIFMVFIVLLSLGCLAAWIWAIIDIIKSDFKDSVTKLVWLIVVIVFSFLGTVMYLFFGRETKRPARTAPQEPQTKTD